MAITAEGHKGLLRYIEDATRNGPSKQKVYGSVLLTKEQVEGLTAILTEYWGRTYECPAILDIHPKHGYESRVFKDGYSPEVYVEWLVAACSDVAEPTTEPATGRPRLTVYGVIDERGRKFDLVIPVCTDAHGRVYVNDVIPKGLPPRHKKTAPSADP